ncbi:MAG: hypothetical protein ACFN1A_05735 [Corynebacterium matruchotii]
MSFSTAAAGVNPLTESFSFPVSYDATREVVCSGLLLGEFPEKFDAASAYHGTEPHVGWFDTEVLPCHIDLPGGFQAGIGADHVQFSHRVTGIEFWCRGRR